MKTMCTCANCGTTFEYERKRKARKYCSQRCASSYFGKHLRDKASERQRQVKFWAEYPEKAMLYRLRSAAKRQGQVCTVTAEWLKTKLDRGICEITGLPLSRKPYKRGDVGKRSFFAPSIDRINNDLGYTQANVRLTCWGYNLCKNSFTDREVSALAVSTVLNALPPKYRDDVVDLLPPQLLNSLPAGSLFMEILSTEDDELRNTPDAA